MDFGSVADTLCLMQWLQSSQQADLFDNLFVRLNPAYLTGLSPIVSLSVGVAVTSSLETNLPERLSWLEVVLQTVNLHVWLINFISSHYSVTDSSVGPGYS